MIIIQPFILIDLGCWICLLGYLLLENEIILGLIGYKLLIDHFIEFADGLEMTQIFGRCFNSMNTLIKYIFQFRRTSARYCLIELVLQLVATLWPFICHLKTRIIHYLLELRLLRRVLARLTNKSIIFSLRIVIDVFLFAHHVYLPLFECIHRWRFFPQPLSWYHRILRQVHPLAPWFVDVVLLFDYCRVWQFS